MRLRSRNRSKATVEELRVIAALLGRGESAERLLRQVAEAPDLDRTCRGDAYSLTLRETHEELLVDLDDDLATDWQDVRDEQTGALLGFRVVLRQGGFFSALEGRTREGEWPEKWHVEDAALHRLRAVELPRAYSCDLLVEWLKAAAQSDVAVHRLACRAPAEPQHLQDLQRRERHDLPPDFVEMLARSDGLRIGRVEVHGSRDLFVTELTGEPWWVVASLRGEFFAVKHATDPSTPYLWVEHGRNDPRQAEALGSTAATLVGTVLAREG